jgi:hypothetical protein
MGPKLARVRSGFVSETRVKSAEFAGIRFSSLRRRHSRNILDLQVKTRLDEAGSPACHAEGRGFESLQRSHESPANRRAFSFRVVSADAYASSYDNSVQQMALRRVCRLASEVSSQQRSRNMRTCDRNRGIAQAGGGAVEVLDRRQRTRQVGERSNRKGTRPRRRAPCRRRGVLLRAQAAVWCQCCCSSQARARACTTAFVNDRQSRCDTARSLPTAGPARGAEVPHRFDISCGNRPRRHDALAGIELAPGSCRLLLASKAGRLAALLELTAGIVRG